MLKKIEYELLIHYKGGGVLLFDISNESTWKVDVFTYCACWIVYDIIVEGPYPHAQTYEYTSLYMQWMNNLNYDYIHVCYN